MNLLPVKIVRRRQLLALAIRLAAIQAVIFLLIILAVWLFDFTIGIRAAFITELDRQISAERFLQSEAAAQALRDFHLHRTAELDLAHWLELPTFESERLSKVKAALPEGVWLLHVNLDEGGAALTLLTRNLSLADIHREAWISSGLVEFAQMTSAVAVEDAMVRYVLTLRWANEE